MMRGGRAYLIGAGPGDPRLLTLRAVEALEACELVLVDDLVHHDVLRHAKRARIVHVGKRCGRHSSPQEMTTRILVGEVRRGRVVGRLKGGDPFLFGRGGEEALALAEKGLAFEIIPGVSSALGAAAWAGIPLTHRGRAASVTFVAAHAADGRAARVSARPGETLVLFMCQRTIHAIAGQLVHDGLAEATPAALVRGATWAEQRVYLGTLGDLASLPPDWHEQCDPALPTLAIVGAVAALASELAWCGTPPVPLCALASREGVVGF